MAGFMDKKEPNYEMFDQNPDEELASVEFDSEAGLEELIMSYGDPKNLDTLQSKFYRSLDQEVTRIMSEGKLEESARSFANMWAPEFVTESEGAITEEAALSMIGSQLISSLTDAHGLKKDAENTPPLEGEFDFTGEVDATPVIEDRPATGDTYSDDFYSQLENVDLTPQEGGEEPFYGMMGPSDEEIAQRRGKIQTREQNVIDQTIINRGGDVETQEPIDLSPPEAGDAAIINQGK